MSVLAAALLAACAAAPQDPGPPIDIYAYEDAYGHRYALTLVKGRIRDTSRVTGPDGKEIEVLEWSERPDGSLKHKTIRSAIRGGDLPDSCKVLPESTCIRPTGEILRVLRKLTPGLRATYNRHLRDGDFGGRISVMMKIGPAGKIEYLYLIGNTTGRHRFALEILRHLNAWTFSPNDNDMFELVTVPFDFSQ